MGPVIHGLLAPHVEGAGGAFILLRTVGRVRVPSTHGLHRLALEEPPGGASLTLWCGPALPHRGLLVPLPLGLLGLLPQPWLQVLRRHPRVGGLAEGLGLVAVSPTLHPQPRLGLILPRLGRGGLEAPARGLSRLALIALRAGLPRTEPCVRGVGRGHGR